MRYTLISIIASMGLVACSQASVTATEKPTSVVPVSGASERDKLCGADKLQNLIGQSETKLESIRFKGPIRIIKPGMAVTKDYRQNRINFDIDDNGIIARISCG